MDLLSIRRIPTTKGVRSVLTYWHRGARYRPVLGYNLKPEQERQAALQLIAAIHENTSAQGPPSNVLNDACMTFGEFIQTYLQYLKVKRPSNDGRNETIISKHLKPFFENKPLSSIKLEDGLAYLEKRRADVIGQNDNKHAPAAGTIERECAVLMAILNLAVDMDLLDKNRLKRLPVPEYIKRERVLESWELLKLKESASANVWRLVMAALQTGLRENKLIETHEEWLMKRGDGYWLSPSPGQTKIKGVPKILPLNALAREALFAGMPRIGGRFFSHWKDANSFKHNWSRTCERAGIHDLHFHDLRHTFSTWLTQCGVDYAVIQTLKGEPLPGSAKYYIHNWDSRLRDAVMRLENFTRSFLAEENLQKPPEVPLSATQVPPSYVERSLSMRNVVPRDRIELSTPAFSGLCSTN